MILSPYFLLLMHVDLPVSTLNNIFYRNRISSISYFCGCLLRTNLLYRSVPWSIFWPVANKCVANLSTVQRYFFLILFILNRYSWMLSKHLNDKTCNARKLIPFSFRLHSDRKRINNNVLNCFERTRIHGVSQFNNAKFDVICRVNVPFCSA